MGESTGFESFSGRIDDNGEPATALDIAGQAVRDFNHRSQGYMRLTRPGWRFAPDAYRALGELTALAGDPDGAVEAASVALGRAGQAAHQMLRGISDAQTAINATAYASPDSDEDDEEL